MAEEKEGTGERGKEERDAAGVGGEGESRGKKERWKEETGEVRKEEWG